MRSVDEKTSTSDEAGTPSTPNDTTTTTVERGDTSGPGNPVAYDGINGLTSCVELQHEFDIAAENNDRAEPGTDAFDVTLSYMEAADERLEELDRYWTAATDDACPSASVAERLDAARTADLSRTSSGASLVSLERHTA